MRKYVMECWKRGEQTVRLDASRWTANECAQARASREQDGWTVSFFYESQED